MVANTGIVKLGQLISEVCLIKGAEIKEFKKQKDGYKKYLIKIPH